MAVAPSQSKGSQVPITECGAQRRTTKCKFDESDSWETEQVPVIERWLIESVAIPAVLKEQDPVIPTLCYTFSLTLPRWPTWCPIIDWQPGALLGTFDDEASIIGSISAAPCTFSLSLEWNLFWDLGAVEIALRFNEFSKRLLLLLLQFYFLLSILLFLIHGLKSIKLFHYLKSSRILRNGYEIN